MPLTVSVIIPAYNAEAFLAEAVESAIASTYPPEEIIIVDDGSSDRTAEIAKKLACSNPAFVRTLSHADGRRHGVAATANRGAREATADLLALVASDDRILPNHLARAVQVFSIHPEVALLFGRARILKLMNHNCYADSGGELGKGHKHGIIPDAFDRILDGCYIPASTMVCRRDAFVAVGGFDEKLEFCEDRLLWAKLAYRYHVYNLDEACAEYRVHPLSLTARVTREGAYGTHEVACLEALSEWMPRTERAGWSRLDAAWRRTGDRILYRLFLALRSRDHRQARRELAAFRRVRLKACHVIAPLRWAVARMSARTVSAELEKSTAGASVAESSARLSEAP